MYIYKITRYVFYLKCHKLQNINQTTRHLNITYIYIGPLGRQKMRKYTSYVDNFLDNLRCTFFLST